MFLKNFSIYLSLRYFIHFDLIFICIDGGIQLHSFNQGYPVVQVPFVKEFILFSLNYLNTLVKDQLMVTERVCFLTFKLYSIDLSIYMRVLYYYSFSVSFEIEKCKSSLFFFPVSFGYFVSLDCHASFGIHLSISIWKSAGILTEIILN